MPPPAYPSPPHLVKSTPGACSLTLAFSRLSERSIFRESSHDLAPALQLPERNAHYSSGQVLKFLALTLALQRLTPIRMRRTTLRIIPQRCLIRAAFVFL